MSPTVYIVDDDAAAREALYRLLTAQSGLVVRVFQSGDDFLAARSMLEGGVVLLDYDMPGANGMDVLARIADDSRFATIFVTGWSDVALAVRAMKAGAVDFLEKPYEPEALVELVRATLDQLGEGRAREASRAAAQKRLARLSMRERDVLVGLIAGRRNKVIAEDLGISARTVEIYRGNMMEKLGAETLADALRVAFAAGMAVGE